MTNRLPPDSSGDFERPTHFVLDDAGNATPAGLMEWARWLETAGERRVLGRSKIGDVVVSTVFVGLDMRMLPGGPPLLWETMIFGGPEDQWQERYASKAEAIAGHARAVRIAKAAEILKQPGERLKDWIERNSPSIN